MKEIHVDSLKVGDTLAGDICCEYSYRNLLSRGTVITREHIEKLRQFNVRGFCVVLDEQEAAGLRFDLLDQVTDEKVKRAYLDTFVVGKSIYENMARGNPINIRLASEAVELLVEQMLQNSSLLMQLATVRVVDDYTFSHMVNVALYAAAFGRSLKLSESDIRDLCLAGLLHDVGKAKLPQEILQKPSDLTEAEFTEMKRHTEYAYAELGRYPELNERVRQAALQHHERGDGSGYPRGLKKEQTSMFGRIIAIVDVYDALTSDRCYRGRFLPHETAEILMGDCSLNRLDPELVRVFLKHIALYPPGVEVVLSDGRRARVKRLHTDFPLRPVLDILGRDDTGNWVPLHEEDLMKHPTLFISRVLA
ncbi:MAG: HD-GYP domain-containing protein [Bacillota bacterium]|nr:HD-GYP domain-containing protein [Bacillota bacterium]MDW7682756.1 HD-GYP domain-containing protein [Bacillota bacterium]